MQITNALKLAHARAMIRVDELFPDALANDLMGHAGKEHHQATEEVKHYEEVVKGYHFVKLCSSVEEARAYVEEFHRTLIR